MNRLKLLVVLLVALGALGYLVFASRNAFTTESENWSLRVATQAVAQEVNARTQALQTAALAVGTSAQVRLRGERPSVTSEKTATSPPPELVTVAHFKELQQLVLENIPADYRERTWVVTITPTSSLIARGLGEPHASTDGSIDDDIAKAGDARRLATVEGESTLFISVPLLADRKGEVVTAGRLILGMEVAPSAARLTSIAKNQDLVALGLLAAGNLVAESGPQRGLLATAMRGLKPNSTAALESGTVKTIGPLALPLFVGPPALITASRAAVEPFEVLAVASTRERAVALAEFQQAVGVSLAALLVVGLLMLVLVNDGYSGRMVVQTVPTPAIKPPVEKSETQLDLDNIEAHEPAPEASPDEFDVPLAAMSSPRPQPSTRRPTAPTEIKSPPPREDEDDPFAAAAPIAPAPQTLSGIRASAISSPSMVARSSRPATLPEPRRPSPMPITSADERHFEEVFREFVATREKCGESLDAVTPERFRARLLTNREQMIQKYNCRSVRFQVSVKDGKASLRAIPV